MTAATRMPTYFLSHGGGPWPYMTGPFRKNFDWLEKSLQDIARQLPLQPTAILMVTGHWETPTFMVSSSPAPGMHYDYSGFPEEMYHLSYPAPGSPELAARAQALLGDAGFGTGEDAQRGYDHGTFSLMKPLYPDAEIPVVQLSVKDDFDAAEHLRAGAALAPLRDEGVLIVGSGFSFHNLRLFGEAGAKPAALFDAWLRESLAADPVTRAARLARWQDAPAARQAHPREDHLLPLMVTVGAAGADPATVVYGETFMGVAASSFRFSQDTTASGFDRLRA
jgi:aromatic ring-opening dioxygenase catalytic subunit (LigB family)